MLRTFGVALLVMAWASPSMAATKVVKVAPGTVTGELSYASGQYWIRSGKETLCVMVDPPDEAALEPLVDSAVSFTGPIQLWSDQSRCVVIGPDFPEPAKTVTGPRIVPVVIGAHGQPDLDACLSMGAMTSPVAVRLAPDPAAATSVRLSAGQDAYLCGTSADGAWESIVVPPAPGADCGVSGAVETPHSYAGPCKSGWVPVEQVEVIAG